jgi:hypothetical protein
MTVVVNLDAVRIEDERIGGGLRGEEERGERQEGLTHGAIA